MLLLLSLPAMAETKTPSSQVATFTQIDGKTELFTRPSKTPYPEKSLKEGSMALFEGYYYLIQTAKVNDTITQGSVVRTLPGAHARIVYENGDQFYVGPGTSYRINWNEKTDLDADVQLLYGRLRGVISKEGPRKEIHIRTRAATLGVRGTDFWVAAGGQRTEMEVLVLRGSVEVTPQTEKGKATPTVVKMGMTASVAAPTDNSKADAVIALRSSTKEDLERVQRTSVYSTAPSSNEKIAKLEKKAIEVTLKDIQLYQPEFYKQVSDKPVASVEELNTKMVSIAQSAASPAPKKVDPKKGVPDSAIDDLDEESIKMGD